MSSTDILCTLCFVLVYTGSNRLHIRLKAFSQRRGAVSQLSHLQNIGERQMAISRCLRGRYFSKRVTPCFALQKLISRFVARLANVQGRQSPCLSATHSFLSLSLQLGSAGWLCLPFILVFLSPFNCGWSCNLSRVTWGRPDPYSDLLKTVIVQLKAERTVLCSGSPCLVEMVETLPPNYQQNTGAILKHLLFSI